MLSDRPPVTWKVGTAFPEVIPPQCGCATSSTGVLGHPRTALKPCVPSYPSDRSQALCSSRCSCLTHSPHLFAEPAPLTVSPPSDNCSRDLDQLPGAPAFLEHSVLGGQYSLSSPLSSPEQNWHRLHSTAAQGQAPIPGAGTSHGLPSEGPGPRSSGWPDKLRGHCCWKHTHHSS